MKQARAPNNPLHEIQQNNHLWSWILKFNGIQTRGYIPFCILVDTRDRLISIHGC